MTGLLGRLADQAHLWLTPLGDAIPPRVEASWQSLLSAEEEASWRRFRVAGARNQHLAARALVRTTLSRYLDVEPRRWRFAAGLHGRPEIERPTGLPPLRFNLSHTRGLVACLVTLGLDAGVDVEHDRNLRDPLALADHSFAPWERRALRRLRGRARRERFYDLWTLKEAYVKAVGGGFLSLPTRRFGYRIDAGGTVEMRFDPRVEDRPGDWQLVLLAPSREHRLAVAIRRGTRPDLKLAVREVEPLRPEPRRRRPPVLARSPAPDLIELRRSGAKS